MFRFSTTSEKRLAYVAPIILQILDDALEISKVDFGIPEFGGLRSAKEQNHLYKRGVSKCDGYEKLSYHQSGKAIDFYAFVDGKASWQGDHLAMVACAILQAATKYNVEAKWGGLWKAGSEKNGVQYGWDAGHIEFIL